MQDRTQLSLSLFPSVFCCAHDVGNVSISALLRQSLCYSISPERIGEFCNHYGCMFSLNLVKLYRFFLDFFSVCFTGARFSIHLFYIFTLIIIVMFVWVVLFSIHSNVVFARIVMNRCLQSCIAHFMPNDNISVHGFSSRPSISIQFCCCCFILYQFRSLKSWNNTYVFASVTTRARVWRRWCAIIIFRSFVFISLYLFEIALAAFYRYGWFMPVP